MFKNIQKYLLINHPLLWNLKVVPVTFYLIIFHIVFFLLGYFNGAINFIETADNYDYNSNQDIIISLGVFISIISFILWAVFYFKNNSLKSFYPKTKFSLFKEWLLILLITFLLTSFTISFFYGKDIRVRSYFTEAEAKRRCEILSQGSMFVEGSYSEHYNGNDGSYTDTEATVAVATIGIVTVDSVKTEAEKEYFYYKGVLYSNYSLLNKNINSYSFFNYENDSLRKMKLKDWMANNQKEQIRTLFKNYLAIAKEHNLKANIDENKWMDLVYNYPAFTEYKIIGGEEKSIFYDINNENVVNAIDTTSQYIKKIGNYDYLVNRFYVPEKALNYSYNKIADSWNKPLVSFETFLIVLYIAFCLSLVVFSFRVTSGKNWLIALVTTGVINIIIGIVTAFSSPYVFFGFQVAFFIGLLIYFFSRLYGKKGKGVSGITNTILLWMVTPFFPIVYGLCLESIKEISGYNDTDYIFRKKLYPRIEYLDDIVPHLLYLNLALVVIMMLFLSTKIKKWRGVAED